MKEFHYTLKNPMGFHARPVALLTKIASDAASEIFLEASGKTVSAKRLMDLMRLSLKYGDEVHVRITGPDEEGVFLNIKELFEREL